MACNRQLGMELNSQERMSSKKGLSDLVKDIKLECRHRHIFFHSLHISGQRMIALGFDGLSRGDLDSPLTSSLVGPEEKREKVQAEEV